VSGGLSALRAHVVHPAAAGARGDRTRAHVPAVRARLSLRRGALERDATARLRALLAHARASVPLHRERFDAAGFDPGVADLPGDLARLPPTTKADLVTEAPRLLAVGARLSELVDAQTGGTTGTPIPFLQTRASVAEKDAATRVLRERMGWAPGDAAALLWGALQDAPAAPKGSWKRAARALWERRVMRSLWLPAGELSDARLDEYAARLAAFRPRVLQAYPSAADLLARRLLARGARVPIPLVVLTAEPVLPEPRARIAEAFQATVRTFYGARECGWIAAETASCPRLHLNTAGVHLDVEPDGRLLVTDLVNRAMPLVRYEIGDLGAIADARCGCGDPRPVVAALHGRSADAFRLPSGRVVPGVSLDRHGPFGLGIAEWQMAQRGRTVRFRYVPGPPFRPESLEVLRARLVEAFFGEMEVRFERVERIAPGPNGKLRTCVVESGPESPSEPEGSSP
jgi:phenylacetate-CoA ligase